MVKSEPPIEVHERWIDFPGRQPVISSRELKSEFIVNAAALKVLALIKDESKIKSWQDHVKNYKLYFNPDTTVWEEYSCHDIPWPLSDQDSFVQYRLVETIPGREYFISFLSRVDPKTAPVIESTNRLELTGSWKLEVISAEVTKVTYRVQSIPTTNIPRMILDPVIRTNLVSSMKSLTKLLENKN